MTQLLWGLLLLHLLTAAVLSGDLLLRHKEPLATLAWLQGILFLPFFGSALYLAFGAGSIQRKRYRRRRKLARSTESSPGAPPVDAVDPSAFPEGPWRDALAVAKSAAPRPPTGGNAIRIFDNVSEMYDALAEAVRRARRHVHFEFYLFQPDHTGRRFLSLLEEKAREGVEVRLLLDAVGSRSLQERHLLPLLRAGGAVGWFLPLRAFPKVLSVHLRNHRKIAVIDGAVAFTGGANIGDEYRGRRARRAHWRDTHLRVEGPAVLQLQEVFAEDWWFATDRRLQKDHYFPEPRRAGKDVVHVVPSGPDDPAEAIHANLFHAIATARERVWIETPYFVPDAPIAAALESAARRGVDVRLLVPERSDHPLVDRAGESFLPRLLGAGVKAFRYEAGILHSKLVAIDGRWGILGSANMDIRSFRINFEVNLIAFSADVTRRIESIFQRDLVQSHPVGLSDLASTPLQHQLTVAACRLLAPIL